ncbi:cadmium-translocating P-type ATPase [Alkalibacter sp. M17DMB]|uniref:heavy metal translocating P-type ATPase n=1 Tax=Alkalibacter mobilis TaxID=2787712 RepID=UPI0018A02CBC|nr:heavy metal translocating P-type ATPase [Alkalibacter mobilis]MBF7096032.1 cadmium-translocating P-type ATPase [Alkalibacter mobilis]
MIKIILEGLNCSNCAGKIEDHTNKLPEVESARINFVNSTLEVVHKESVDVEGLIEKVEKLVKRFEPDVVVRLKKDGEADYQGEISSCEACEINPGEKTGEAKKSLVKYFMTRYRLLAGIAFYAFAVAYGDKFLDPLFWFLIAYGLIGYDVVKTAVKNILRGEVFDENFLMFIATVGAFFLGEYIEAVAVMLFYEVGEVFQSYAVDNSRKSIKDLVDLKAAYANRVDGKSFVRVSPESLEPGDRILVKPGEKVPVDGKIIKGMSLLDTSALTGESIPRELTIGEDVLGGFINTSSTLEVEVSNRYQDSTVAKVLNLIENASSKKSNTEKFITKFARYYTPAVVFMALAISVIPPLLTGDDFGNWLQRGLIFLVISCPCALVISIPLGYFGGIGAASKEGILIKGSQYLEALKNMDTLVMDKTGTLTKGVFEVVEMESSESSDVTELVRFAAIAEEMSNHPIALSVRDKFTGDIDIDRLTEYTEIGGKGVSVLYDGRPVIAGNSRLMRENGIEPAAIEEIGTVVHVAFDGRYLGYILIADEIKETSLGLVEKLKEVGIKRTVMLTGDHENIALHVRNRLNIDEYRSELLPQEKVEIFEELKKSKRDRKTIGFVGDGINDAPVLALSDIGISMGSVGSDAAVEASDVVIMKDDPAKIVEVIRIAKYTHKIVLQNIVFALGVKALVMGLGALGMANMWAAVFADVGVALIAVLNVSRIFYAGKRNKS